MKRVLMSCLIVMCLTIPLLGCQVSGVKSEAQSFEIRLEKTEKIDVYSPEKADSITSIHDSHEINSFIGKIKVEDWKLEAVPSEEVKWKKIKLYHKETIKWDDSREGQQELVEMATIILYDGAPYIDFSIKNNTFSFKVPEDVAEFLSGYD